MLERLARWSYTHRWRILAIWIVALVGSVFLANVAGGDYASNFSLPGSEAQQALDLLKARFPTDRVYEIRPDSELRLITCGGAFDAARRSYRDDIVVTALPVPA